MSDEDPFTQPLTRGEQEAVDRIRAKRHAALEEVIRISEELGLYDAEREPRTRNEWPPPKRGPSPGATR